MPTAPFPPRPDLLAAWDALEACYDGRPPAAMRAALATAGDKDPPSPCYRAARDCADWRQACARRRAALPAMAAMADARLATLVGRLSAARHAAMAPAGADSAMRQEPAPAGAPAPASD